jgi:hypothetical protein
MLSLSQTELDLVTFMVVLYVLLTLVSCMICVSSRFWGMACQIKCGRVQWSMQRPVC